MLAAEGSLDSSRASVPTRPNSAVKFLASDVSKRESLAADAALSIVRSMTYKEDRPFITKILTARPVVSAPGPAPAPAAITRRKRAQGATDGDGEEDDEVDLRFKSQVECL